MHVKSFYLLGATVISCVSKTVCTVPVLEEMHDLHSTHTVLLLILLIAATHFSILTISHYLLFDFLFVAIIISCFCSANFIKSSKTMETSTHQVQISC